MSLCVIYIKLPLYVKEFMRAEYGDPVVLPSCFILHDLIKQSLFKEPCFDRHNLLSMSQRSWLAKDNIHELTSVDDIDKFTCFALPELVKRNGKLCYVDGSCNISVKSARVFRNEACKFFWNALEQYRTNLSLCYVKDGSVLTRTALLEDFMAIHNISVVHYDTINRQWRRIAKNNSLRGYQYISEVRNRCLQNIKARGDVPFSEKLRCVKNIKPPIVL